jgi:hypothetical protein
MFEKLIKKTKTFRAMVFESEAIHEQLDNEIELLQEELKTLKSSGITPISEGNSSILFEIDNDLNIKTKSRINKDIVNSLIDNEYLTSAQSEDDAVIQLVFVLLANEATEQIIDEVNENAN